MGIERKRMINLDRNIRNAIRDGRYFFTMHGDERLRQRKVDGWQLIASVDTAETLEIRPRSHPNPKILLRHLLPDGTSVVAVWAWGKSKRITSLVTVYFEDQ